MSDDEIDPVKKGRNWHKLQECAMLEYMEKFAKYRPVAGSNDAKLKNKMDSLWTPLAIVLNMDNYALLPEIEKLPGSLLGRESFDGGACLRKFRTWQTKYREVKSKFDVGDHIKAGQTGLAQEDEDNITLPGNSAAIEEATDTWHLFARFHALYGSKARFATGNHVDNLTPTKEKPPTKRLSDGKAKTAAEKSSGEVTESVTGDDVVVTKKRLRKLSSRQLDLVMDKTDCEKNATLDTLRANMDRQIAALEKHDHQKQVHTDKRDAMNRVNAHVLELTSTGMIRSEALATAMKAEQEFQAMF